MKNKLKAPVMFLIFLLICAGNTFSQSDGRDYIVKVGQKAPDFTLTTTEGKTFRLSENKGKIIMLQFTASWCSVCRKEMPHIESEIWQPLKNKGLVLVGLDRDEPLNKVSDFAKTMKITYPLAPDPEAGVFSMYAKKEAGVTRNVIIDRQGNIAFLTRLYDEKEFNEMKKIINDLISKK